MRTLLGIVCCCVASLLSCSDEYPHVEARSADFPPWLDAGPMLGHVGTDEVRLWYRLAPSAAEAAPRAEISVDGGPFVAASEVLDRGDSCRIAIFRKVGPGSFVARVAPSGEGSSAASVTVSGKFAPAPSDTGRVVVAFGSCSRDSEFGRTPVFAHIPTHAPDLMVWAGDNSYFVHGGTGPTRFSTTTKDGDWDSREKMLARHLQTRRLPSLEKVLRSVPSYATWDDHDYGANDADARFVHKEAALEAFSQVWANPDKPEGAPREGVATSFRHGPVECWLLDGRWFKRTRDEKKRLLPDATIWGAEQVAWLEASLLASDAPVKLIVSGTQIFEEGFVGEGHWQEAKQERARFEAFLREKRIDGVIVLSGDRHHHELMKVGPVDGAFIYEFTSSPFQYGQKVGPIPKERGNKTRIWGTRGNGFGLVTIDIKGPRSGSIRFDVFGEDGATPKDAATPCTATIRFEELCYDR